MTLKKVKMSENEFQVLSPIPFSDLHSSHLIFGCKQNRSLLAFLQHIDHEAKVIELLYFSAASDDRVDRVWRDKS